MRPEPKDEYQGMMKRFASFVVSGQLPAFAVVFGFLLLAFILPLSVLISAAAIVLITLHQSTVRGLVTAAMCALALSICGYFLLGQMGLETVMVVAQLLPAIILASILRLTRSLSFSLQATALLGALTFLGIMLLFPGLDQMWEEILQQVLLPVLQGIFVEQPYQLIQQSARLMTGMLVASAVLTNSSVLLLGYWWHCLVTGRGNFQHDFRQIRLGKVLAIITALSGIWALVTKSLFAMQLSGIVGILFLLQGMAVIHVVMAALTKGKIWLTAIYVLVVLVPQSLLVVILLGLTDTFAGIRERV